jgi:LAS superfamily LD-carboxypeptidase LdcB
MQTTTHTYLRTGGIVLGSLAILGACGYGLYSYTQTIKSLKSELASTATELAKTRASSEKNYQDIKDTLAGVQHSATSLSEQLIAQEQKSSDVEQRVGAVSSTVGTLEKLSKTDPELLKKYSKVYFLNEHYVPISLSAIAEKYLLPDAKNLQIHANVRPQLENLLAAAESAGLGLRVDSAFRSFGTQAVLKASYRVTYGAGTANSFSAEQGYSEHQLGTTVDFTTVKLAGGLSGFEKTPEYTWLKQNASRYGFVLSYPENNTSYQFEPWHWRFVGVRLAIELQNQNKFFYDTDQRVIDTYLVNIFD